MTIISTTITNPTAARVTTAGSSVRTGADDLRAVPAALRSEWIKFQSLRTNKVILALAGVVAGVLAWGLAGSKGDPTLTASELFIYPMPLIATMAIVAGILLFTGEAQHGTLAGALTARPARWVLVTAKTTTAIAVGLTLGANAMLAGFVGSVAGGLPVGDASTMVSRVLWALAYVASAAVIGLGVGMIVRHSAGAISGLLMWAFVIESLFAPSLPEGVVHALPFSAGYRLLDAGANFEPPVVIAQELARYQYALIFGGYALVALVVGTVLLYRRDTN